jgi:Amidohydrolase
MSPLITVGDLRRTLVTFSVFALLIWLSTVILRVTGSLAIEAQTTATAGVSEFNDSHFHLTNYIQKGIDVPQFVQIMGTRVGRSTLFGIPLQQQWSYANSGDFAPTYYLHSDAPLYYYSFTDAHIASVYRALSDDEQARFDPMITGFNPADMYAVDHIRRALTLFPGVFTGIGEFSIHKEFVSSKIFGETASLTNPALDRIFELAAEVGLVVIIHNDIDMPFAAQNAKPVYLTQMTSLLKRHPNTTVIWAHLGLGRVVRPVRGSADVAEHHSTHLRILESLLADPELMHMSFDISWDEVAKYAVATPETVAQVTAMLNRHADRFLFGTDTVAPAGPNAYFAVYDMWAPVWKGLTPEASSKIRKGNYERLFDRARTRVRAWERAHVN